MITTPAPDLPRPAVPLPADAYAALDADAEAAGRLHRLPGGEAETWIAIDGMVCAACAQTLEAALAAVPGVRQARVTVMTERARVRWLTAAAPLSALYQAIAAAGYRPFPADSAAREAARRSSTRLALWRLLVAAAAMMQVMMYAAPEYLVAPGDITPDLVRLLRWAQWMVTLPVMLFCAWPILANAVRSLRAGRVAMDLPAGLGIVLAFVASSQATFTGTGHVWFDSVTMFVFFLLLARWLQAHAQARATARLERLGRALPSLASRRASDGRFETVAASQLAAGDVIRVPAGEAFAVDGQVVAGATAADEALLTGESRAVAKPCGARVRAGSTNLLDPVLVRVEQVGADATLGRIRQLIDEAAAARPGWMRTADRWASVFLIGVLTLAGLAWLGWQWVDPTRALPVAIAILIVTCPCALSLATPAAMLSATAALARRGIWLRHPAALERLARVDHVAFDKTGTLTHGAARLLYVTVIRAGMDHTQAHALAAALAAWSRHPRSRAIAQAASPPQAVPVPVTVAGSPAADRASGQAADLPPAQADPRQPPAVDTPSATEVREIPGAGLIGTIAGRRYRLGHAAFAAGSVARAAQVPAGTWLADDVDLIAHFDIDDPVREDARATLTQLQRQGVAVALLSGDTPARVARLVGRLPLAEAHGGMSPQAKLARIRAWQADGGTVAMVGDGINDGPALAGADLSIALGDATRLAQDQADIILADARLTDIARARELAHRAVRVMRQNLAWSLTYNTACVPLAVLGYMPPWAAGLGMALSSMLVIGNGLRLMREPVPALD